jgi:hypothetical protein
VIFVPFVAFVAPTCGPAPLSDTLISDMVAVLHHAHHHRHGHMGRPAGLRARED